MQNNLGKTKVLCSHSACSKHGFVSVMERSCLDDDGIAWMCKKHDDQRTYRCNANTALVR